MEIVLIAALTRDHVIGCRGRLPWHYPTDLRRFRHLTLGNPVIMGRVTYEGLPRRPLPGRTNLVLSRQAGLRPPGGALACASLEEALERCRAEDRRLVYVAGGGQVFAAALPLATALELTWVPDRVEGDARFPPLAPEAWEIVDSSQEGGLTFATYRRAGTLQVIPQPTALKD